MHNLFTCNPAHFLDTSRRCGEIHVPAGRCQEWVSVITQYLRLSRLKVSHFQASLLPAKFCPRKIKPGPSAWHCSLIWKLPKAPRLTQSRGEGFTQGLKGDDFVCQNAKMSLWLQQEPPSGRLKADLQIHLYCSSHYCTPCEPLSVLPCRATSSQGQQPSHLPSLILSLSLQTKTELPPPDCQNLNSSQVHVLAQSTLHTWCIQPIWQISSAESFAYTRPCNWFCTQWSHQWNTPRLDRTPSDPQTVPNSPERHFKIPHSGIKTVPHFHTHHVREVNVIPEWKSREACRLPGTIHIRTTAVHRNQFSGAAGKAGAATVAKPKCF